MKGSFFDIATAMVLIFAIAIGLIISYAITSEFTTVSELNQSYINQTQAGLEVFNYGFVPLVILVFFVGMVVLSSLIPTHPIFLPISIIFLTICVLASAFLSNFFSEIISNEPFLTASANFGIIVTVMYSLPLWITLIGGGVIIAFFAKARADSRA